MNLKTVAAARLVNQQLGKTRFKIVKDIVAWFGAMQAQEFKWVKWALGVRLPDHTEENVEAAFAKGKILRTHLLRPTWHFVSPDDICWMLELSAPQINASLRSRQKQLEINDSLVKKCNKIIEGILKDKNHLTREEIAAGFVKKGIRMDSSRAAHIMLRAELDGLVCSGKPVNNKQTYALLEERVPEKKILKREEALAELAERYYTSRGPASLQDFTWWSGLSVTDAKRGLEIGKSKLISESIEGITYWLKDTPPAKNLFKDSLYLLPAYDEFIISYKDRSASIPFENLKKSISNNGIFRPVVVFNGKVIGIWSAIKEKEDVNVKINSFRTTNQKIKSLIEEASERFGNYLNKNAKVRYLKR
jgi:uncharacterized protein YehS (DUF1456 family)